MLLMKKIVLSIIAALTLVSCTTEGEEFTLEVLPVAKVVTPTAFKRDSITNIPVTYLRPTNCHFFEDFYYDRLDFTRVIAIYNSRILKENTCLPRQNDSVVVNLRFKPVELGTYNLKFWKGTNSSGQDEFFEIQAVVNN